ncbi:hypothetical protein WN55_03251 [Dufourea novaeangliae]|uniref:Uncharacterized protein n=1 Tax=Dufourea novaeangliae TaxID=178035 RepID=A0A154PLR8_DUFNO|nr:hypothetical protein WN55_03251 [Dufourea novaeangliae]
MDDRILKAVLCSCESATKDLENSEDYQKLINEEKFLPTSSNIFNALCLSLTNLLSYKVSKEAYQRYTVRLNIIDVLRDWCRISEAFKKFPIFRDGKQTSTFLRSLLDKHLTNDFMYTCDSTENLLPLTSALMCLASTDSYYKYHVEKLLVKLTELESCDESERLLCYAVQKKSNLNLELSTVENIYDSQRLCAFLKELLVHLDHCPVVISFIQSILNRIKECCENQGKDILDLYPRNLQSIVILLHIEPTYHTDDSKNTALRVLKNIHSEDKDTAITLLSHFPQWLKLFGEQLSNSDSI